MRVFPIAAFAASLAASVIANPASAQEGVEIGQLNCEVAGGAGYVFGSTKNISCTFSHADGSFPDEVYAGTIQKFGIDVGVTGRQVILWTVVAAQDNLYQPGALAGTYSGATASAAFVAGLGANVLLGGSEDSFALQPISVSAGTGVNLAVGLAQISLERMQ
ncbi:MAG: DUF992 domain-containing protein [Nitratireductor sp.]|nr:DUF992 domain-containing protein [Nitratireductor sp.]